MASPAFNKMIRLLIAFFVLMFLVYLAMNWKRHHELQQAKQDTDELAYYASPGII